MMVRIKWLFIGFVAGAAACGAASKWGCCAPDWKKKGDEWCGCADDAAGDGWAADVRAADDAPAGEAAAGEAATEAGATDEGPAA